MMRRLRAFTGNLEGVDPYLAMALGVLLFYGIPVVWGAGGYADRVAGFPIAPHYMLVRHLIMIGIGVVVMAILANTDHALLRVAWLNRALLAAGLLLVAYTLKDGSGLLAGNPINRWISLGPVNFQPVEAAKLAAIAAMARILTCRPRQTEPDAGQVLRALGLGLAPLAVLLVLQPNFGNVLVMLGVTVAMLFVAGVRLRWLAGGLGGLTLAAAVAVVAVPKLTTRFGDWYGAVFGDKDYPYQVSHSIVGLGAGGVFGVGPGQSHNKFSFLPESHTDFVFSVLGEEWGLFGALIVIAMVTLLAWRGYRIAGRATDPFGRVLAAGLTTSLVIYAVANVGMATGLLPVIGVPLPFVSYGGTVMVGSLATVGILLNIERSARTREVEHKRWVRRGWSG